MNSKRRAQNQLLVVCRRIQLVKRAHFMTRSGMLFQFARLLDAITDALAEVVIGLEDDD